MSSKLFFLGALLVLLVAATASRDDAVEGGASATQSTSVSSDSIAADVGPGAESPISLDGKRLSKKKGFFTPIYSDAVGVKVGKSKKDQKKKRVFVSPVLKGGDERNAIHFLPPDDLDFDDEDKSPQHITPEMKPAKKAKKRVEHIKPELKPAKKDKKKKEEKKSSGDWVFARHLDEDDVAVDANGRFTASTSYSDDRLSERDPHHDWVTLTGAQLKEKMEKKKEKKDRLKKLRKLKKAFKKRAIEDDDNDKYFKPAMLPRFAQKQLDLPDGLTDVPELSPLGRELDELRFQLMRAVWAKRHSDHLKRVAAREAAKRENAAAAFPQGAAEMPLPALPGELPPVPEFMMALPTMPGQLPVPLPLPLPFPLFSAQADGLRGPPTPSPVFSPSVDDHHIRPIQLLPHSMEPSVLQHVPLPQEREQELARAQREDDEDEDEVVTLPLGAVAARLMPTAPAPAPVVLPPPPPAHLHPLGQGITSERVVEALEVIDQKLDHVVQALDEIKAKNGGETETAAQAPRAPTMADFHRALEELQARSQINPPPPFAAPIVVNEAPAPDIFPMADGMHLFKILLD